MSDQLAFAGPTSKGRKVIVGFSGGVTSAWCAGWALRTFPRDEVVLVFHDTKEEHPDTYRFIADMTAALDHSVENHSDGRSVPSYSRTSASSATTSRACARAS